MNRNLRVLALCVIASPLMLGAGCPPDPGFGLDLSKRGFLTLVISRESTSAQAEVYGSINDNAFPFRAISLTDKQALTVNDVKIGQVLGFFQSNLGAVDAPGGYTVKFNNDGAVARMSLVPPADFTSVTPAEGAQVSRQSLDVTWSPSGDADLRVSIEMTGRGPDGSDDNSDPDNALKTIRDLPDNGRVRIGASDLAGFLNGSLSLRVMRFRSRNQELGLADGSVRIMIEKKIGVTLGN